MLKAGKYKKAVAMFFALNLFFEVLWPSAAMALTSGPVHPEAASFEPVGTSDMVDNFSGDFNYNIPLLDVEGYPVNISYHSGATMDQEATWTGLGWNVNVGAITRNMRGVPDDFDGDIVSKQVNMKANETYGITVGVGGEVFGSDAINLNYSLGISYNNYSGYSTHQTLGLSLSPEGFPGTIGLGLTSGEEGLTISPHLSFSTKLGDTESSTLNGSVSVGTSFNSRTGMKSVSLDAGVSESVSTGSDPRKAKNKDGTHKENQHSAGSSIGGTGTSFSFGAATYVPQISLPMKNSSYVFSLKLGGTVFGIDATANIGGTYSKQGLQYTQDNIPAFGYMNAEKGQSLEKVMLDFNREKDGAFSENTPDLPLTNFSYDIFSVTGQGIGSSFRPFRSDLGYVFDSKVTTTSDNNSLSGEVSFGNLVQAGIDYSYTQTDGTSGKWTTNNVAAAVLKFRGKVPGNPLYEPVYFKEAGEKNVDPDPLYDNIWGDLGTRIQLQNTGSFDVFASADLVNEYGAVKPMTFANYRTARVKRDQFLTYIKKSEYNVAAVNKDSTQWLFDMNSSSYDFNGKLTAAGMTKPAFLNSYTGASNNHHIAEITTTKTDGTRYVYGIPLYNIYQKETSFNVSTNAAIPGYVDFDKGYVKYAATDNTSGNTSGIDNFFTSTELPPYVHTHLLTDVLSTDYVDVTGNGPTDDDLGSYTKFSYTDASLYQWRTPFGSDNVNGGGHVATYDAGLHSVGDDERASYLYGFKEVRFLKTIETKNYIAIFELGDRKDGYGVSDENASGANNALGAPMKYLKTIKLYSKPDYRQFGANAFVIKEVHFVYDYELCPGLPNNIKYSPSYNPASLDPQSELSNDGGKLTLKSIYFTYGNSYKAQLSPYQFTYNNMVNGSVVQYDIKGYDRWGNYKPNPNTNNAEASGQQPFNHDYPYVEQDKTKADQYTALWNVSEVKLPSGGKIDVVYESDDYAYVQDKKAMQMFQITASSIPGQLPSAYANTAPQSLFSGTSASGGTSNNVLYFKLRSPIPLNGSEKTVLYKEYLDGLGKLSFRFYTNVNDAQPVYFQQGYDYVSGYADLDLSSNANYGVKASSSAPSGYGDYGYITIQNVTGGDALGLVNNTNGNIENPISRAAWQFARLHTSRQAYNGIGATPGNDQAGFIQSLANASIISNMVQTFEGANGFLKTKSFGKYFDPGRSWIRLFNPNRMKLGGGSRVKQLSISDEWGTMLSTVNNSRTFNYGQVYDYTTKDQSTGEIISSGVAAYEPAYGADENPLRQPIYFGTKPEALMAPDNDYYLEGPLGESFYPAPSVGYSMVTVKNLPRYINPANPSAGLLVNSNATGQIVYEFYTAKDFPVMLRKAGIDPHRKRTNPLGKLLHLDFKDYMTVSEGYCIELNDMNGKPKSQMVYAQGQATALSGMKYYYKHNGNQLDNSCTTMDKAGNITHTRVGVDYDFIADFRHQLSSTTSASMQGNLHDFFIPPFLDVVLPTIIPSFSNEYNQFQSAVVTKVINKYGIQDSTEAYDLSSRIATKNLMWDAETGDVLLTQTTTEFNDNTYSFNYPAYWAYENMGGAYKNTGLVLPYNANVDATGKVSSSASAMLRPGDELEIINGSGVSQGLAWVLSNNSNYYLIDRGGNPVNSGTYSGTGTTMKVIRSGRRNMQASSAGNLTSFANPIANVTHWPALNQTFGVLGAHVIEYDDQWNIFCECGITPSQLGNPYILGLAGNWRQKKAYTYLTLRDQTKLNGNSNIRNDGTFDAFSPYWTPNGGSDWHVNATNWQWTSQVTEYSPHGFEIENVDPLSRYSSALYGYNYSLPVGVASNARYRQTAFDGFEDYDFTPCVDDHFGFKAVSSNTATSTVKQPASTYQKYAHTGRRSFKVTPGQTKTITKILQSCSSGN